VRLACLALVLVACGGSDPIARAPVRRCPITCADVDLRGPLAATRFGERIAVIAGKPTGELVLGYATPPRAGWRAREFAFEDLGGRGPVAIATRGTELFLAHRAERGLTLAKLDGHRVEPVAGLDAEPTDVEIAVRGEAIWVAWATAEGAVGLAELAGTVLRLEPIATPRARDVALAVGQDGGPMVAVASETGVDLVLRNSARVPIAARAADAVALSAGAELAVAWSDAGGVWLRRGAVGAALEAPVAVDDGRRAGDPSHRIGASLVLAEHEDGLRIAFQDQTRGSVVAARVGRVVTRQELASPRFGRGFALAFATTDSAVYLFDLAYRYEGGVRGTVFANPLR
jgi:hypothetical protein